MLLALPRRTSPILRTSSMRLATFYSPNAGEGVISEGLVYFTVRNIGKERTWSTKPG
jgi:hypothetical protein